MRKCFVFQSGSLASTELQPASTSRMMDLRSEIRDLEQKENFLDLQKFWIEQSIRNTTEGCSKYPFFPSNAKRAGVDVPLKCFTVYRASRRFSDPFIILLWGVFRSLEGSRKSWVG